MNEEIQKQPSHSELEPPHHQRNNPDPEDIGTEEQKYEHEHDDDANQDLQTGVMTEDTRRMQRNGNALPKEYLKNMMITKSLDCSRGRMKVKSMKELRRMSTQITHRKDFSDPTTFSLDLVTVSVMDYCRRLRDKNGKRREIYRF